MSEEKEVPKEKKEEVRTPYWQEVLDLSVKRGEDGDFVRTHAWSGHIRDCMVLEVARPVKMLMAHPGTKSITWAANPGDVIIRKWRPANKAEIATAKALTGQDISQVEIAERVADEYALFTALRQFGRNIEESILGTRERVFGSIVELPGQIQRLMDEALRAEAAGKAKGILKKAVELRRILNKIQSGHRSVWLNLGRLYQFLDAGRITTTATSRQLVGTWKHLRMVAAFNPFTKWAESEFVNALSKAESITDREELKMTIVRAMVVIKKGWQGIEIRSDELDRTRKRIQRIDTSARAERRQP